jgi:predicted transcriptional regulator
MLVPCEVAVKCMLPAVRALIATELMTEHKLKQTEVAKLLGVSQPAISLYNRKMRGKALDLEGDPDVTRLTDGFAASLAKGGLAREEFIPMLCEICQVIRAKGLLCSMHKIFDPSIDVENCRLCRMPC